MNTQNIHPFLKKLLNGATVEWKPLGEVCDIANNKRKPIKSSLRSAGTTPYYGANNIQDYVQGFTHEGDYVLIAEDGSASIENYSIQWVTGKFWANNHAHVVKGKKELNNKFLFYYLKTINFVPFLTGLPRAKLNKTNLEKIIIPIPPLAVQSELVKILDKFTELTAELTARKKQYAYYRDKLLTFADDAVEWKPLGEVCETITDYVAAGSFKTIAQNVKYKNEADFAQLVRTTDIKSNFKNGNFVYVDEKAFKFLWRVDLSQESLILPNVGNCGESYYLQKQDLPYKNNVLAPNAILLRSETNNNKFIYYIFKTPSFLNQLKKIISPGGQTKYNKTNLKKIKIPIPPLAEQEKIVNILDKFDTLTNSISEGIPREIELRKKQYEYYRDKLLTFPKATTDAHG